MICAVCIELEMSDSEYGTKPCVTMIDGTSFCYTHARDKIRIRAAKTEQDNAMMAELAQNIAKLKS